MAPEHHVTMGIMGMSGLLFGPNAPPPLQVNCDSCGARIYSEHYHCLQCDDSNYDLCLKCVQNGNACEDDSHQWVKRRIDKLASRPVSVGSKISPSKARTIQTTYPTWFTPPDSDDTPQELFSNDHRFIRKSDPREILIYTDGACLGNGQKNPRAGYSFVYRPSAYTQDGNVTHTGTTSLRLETEGPTGEVYKQTSNRAELRAVIAALQFTDWSTDCNGGWRSLVIATDSEYVAVSVTQRIKNWEKEGWKTFDRSTKRRQDVKNQDLWKLLMSLVRTLQGEGVKVSFWRIPRACNERADKFAKFGAEREEEPHFVMVQPDGPTDIKFKPYPY